MSNLEQDISDSLKILQEIDTFPNNCCKIAVLAMRNKGYPIKMGYIYLDNYCGMGNEKTIVHYWNYDLDSGMNIDLTAEQFTPHLTKEKRLPKIHIWKDNTYSDIYQEISNVPDSQKILF